MAGGASQLLPPGIPGYGGEPGKKGDGVIVDGATELDPGAKAGPLVTPLPGPELLNQIYTTVSDKFKALLSPIITSLGGDSATGVPPPNLTPDGAGRSGAFNEAKRAAGIPICQQPSAVYPNTDKRGNPQPGYQYEFTVPAPGGGAQTVVIRDDAAGHYYAAKAAANDPNLTPEQRAQAQQQADQLNAEWGPRGSYRQVLTALTVTAGGDVTGGMGQFAQNATIAYV